MVHGCHVWVAIALIWVLLAKEQMHLKKVRPHQLRGCLILSNELQYHLIL